MSDKNNKIYIIGALRTPVGKLNGGLSNIRPDDLGVLLLHELLDKYAIPKQKIDRIVLGCANQAGEDNRNLARMLGLLAGLRPTVTATTLNSLCASGMEAIFSGIRGIFCGENDLVLAGGVESMSRSPLIESKADGSIENSLIGWRFTNPKMQNFCPPLSMPETAELLAKKYKINQEEQNQYAYDSRLKYQRALANGIWEQEMIGIKNAKNKPLLTDEQHRVLSLDLLRKLPKLVKGGECITSGNAARVGDGAALLLLASANFVKENNIVPLAVVNDWATAACHPSDMGISAVAACRKLFDKNKIKIENLSCVELSESFAVQAIACRQELGLDPLITNPNGGAISIGNPIATGSARLVVSLVHQLRRNPSYRYGLAASSAGLGIGTALLLEQIKVGSGKK